MQKMAIIGAGIGGLTLAQELKTRYDVTVFEKARGVGGRMSTRYADPYYFDHGTQFLTARSHAFQQFLKPFLQSGVVQEWQGETIALEEGKAPTKRLWFEPHYVACPHMNSLCKALAEGVNVTLSTEIAPLAEKQPDGWYLHDKSGHALGVFEWVISTVPAAQTRKLFHHHLPADHALQQAELRGCYTLMIGLPQRWDQSWIAAKIRNSPLEWIAISSSKPQRHDAVTSIVAHSTHDWAEAHIDANIPAAQSALVEVFTRVTGLDVSEAAYLTAHRWRYANTANPSEEIIPPYCHETLGLAACGDWQGISRIETSWLAAQKLATCFQS